MRMQRERCEQRACSIGESREAVVQARHSSIDFQFPLLNFTVITTDAEIA